MKYIYVNILLLQRHEERVIIISSKLDDKVFSDAENALHQIVSLILKVSWPRTAYIFLHPV